MAPQDPNLIIPSRLKVLEDGDLLDLLFRYLDPASIKSAALVSW